MRVLHGASKKKNKTEYLQTDHANRKVFLYREASSFHASHSLPRIHPYYNTESKDITSSGVIWAVCASKELCNLSPIQTERGKKDSGIIFRASQTTRMNSDLLFLFSFFLSEPKSLSCVWVSGPDQKNFVTCSTSIAFISIFYVFSVYVYFVSGRCSE